MLGGHFNCLFDPSLVKGAGKFVHIGVRVTLYHVIRNAPQDGYVRSKILNINTGQIVQLLNLIVFSWDS